MPALAQVIDKSEFESKVPESLRGFYEEHEGKMRLQLDGTSPLATALEKKKEQLSSATDRIGELENAKTEAERRAAEAADALRKAEAEKAAGKHGLSGDELDKLVKERATELVGSQLSDIEKQLAREKERADSAEGALGTLKKDTLDREVSRRLEAEALKTECWQESADIIAGLARKRGFNALDDEGNLVALDDQGNRLRSAKGSGNLELEEVFAEIRESRQMLWPSKSGTGGRQRAGSGTPAGGSKPLKDMTAQERAMRISHIGLSAYEQEVKDQGFEDSGSSAHAGVRTN